MEKEVHNVEAKIIPLLVRWCIYIELDTVSSNGVTFHYDTLRVYVQYCLIKYSIFQVAEISSIESYNC